MASFYKKNKKWYYVTYIGGIDPETGKRKQKRKGGFDKKSDAELDEAALQVAVENGTYIEETKLTFEQCSALFMDVYAKEAAKASTVDCRRFCIKVLNKYLGKNRVQDIKKSTYRSAMAAIKETYSINSLKIIHNTAQMIFNFAKSDGVISINPAEGYKISEKAKTITELENSSDIPKYLEKSELQHYLDTAKDKSTPQNYLIFLMLAYTGMRIGELLALRWSDIDKNQINIFKTLYWKKDKTGYVLQTPKTKPSVRKIDIPLIVVAELKNHRIRQNHDRITYADVWYNESFVFTGAFKKGMPVRYSVVNIQMKSLLKAAELNETLSLHSLRHTHTSLLAEAGVSLDEIMERLGHADDKITRRVYLHITQTRKNTSTEKFERFMQTL